MTSASLTGFALIFICSTDNMRYSVQQLELEFVTRYYIGYNVCAYFSQFIMSISLIFNISEAGLYLGASLTGE